MSRPSWRWLTPPGACALALARLDALPRGLCVSTTPASGCARLVALTAADGTAVDEAVLWQEEEEEAAAAGAAAWLLSVHGGDGVRAALAACLSSHGMVEDNGHAGELGEHGARWRALARAASPAAVAWRLAHRLEEPPFPARLLDAPANVLITGPANAGKSTLLNAWCGRARALVSPRPGTTRDLVSADALVSGWRLRLTDSAGMGASSDTLERAGQALVAHARARADLVLYLAHPAAPSTPQAGDLVVLGLADQRDARERDRALWWSAVGAGGEEPALGLARLGRAVLARLGLPSTD